MSKERVVIGYDLNREYAQISFLSLEQEEPETVSVVAGTQSYNIPAVLCKRTEINQWFYGREAIKTAEEGKGILVTDLLERARAKEKVIVGEEAFEAVAILALFLKRSLSLLNFHVDSRQVIGMMLTVDRLDVRTIEVLNQATTALGLKDTPIFFQSHLESFYHYVMHQPKELWNRQVGLFDFSGGYLKTYCLESNRQTKPKVVYIDTKEYPQLLKEDMVPGDMDQSFLDVVREMTTGRIVSLAYLIGDGFDSGWCKNSLKELCRGRRVFQGNNLYSKGACFGAREKFQKSEIEEQYVFLGEEKLKANVGMQVFQAGEEAYLALLDAGNNWFEVKKECQVILESGNSFQLLITPLTREKPKTVEIVLEGLARRKHGTTRLHLDFWPVGENRVGLKVRDLGFGEIVPATNQVWQQEFDL